MKSSTLFSFAFVLLSTTLGACAGTEHVYIDEKKPKPASETLPTEATSDAASFCSSLCGRQESCDTSLDVQTCRNSCTNGYAAVFPKLRQDVVGLIVQCFDAKDCKTVLEGSCSGPISTPDALTWVTRAPVLTSTPSFRRDRLAFSESGSG